MTRAQFDAALTAFDAAAYAAMPNTTGVLPASPLPTFPAALDGMEAAAPQWVSPFNGAIRSADNLHDLTLALAASQPGDTVYVEGTIKADPTTANFQKRPSTALLPAPGYGGHLIGSVVDGGGTPDLCGLIQGLLITQDSDQYTIGMSGKGQPGIYAVQPWRIIRGCTILGTANCGIQMYGGFGTGEISECYIALPIIGHCVYTHWQEHPNSPQQELIARNYFQQGGRGYGLQAYSASQTDQNNVQDLLCQDNVWMADTTIGAVNAISRRIQLIHNSMRSPTIIRFGYVDVQNEDLHLLHNDFYLANNNPVQFNNWLTVEDVDNHLESGHIALAGSSPPVALNAPRHPAWFVQLPTRSDEIVGFGFLPASTQPITYAFDGLTLVPGQSYTIIRPYTTISDTIPVTLVPPFVYAPGMSVTLPKNSLPQSMFLKKVV
jgi:hypothetical protein